MLSRTCKVMLALLCLLPLEMSAQKGLSFSDRLESARKLYTCGSYYAAEQAFQELSATITDPNSLIKAEIESYRVLCTIAMDRGNIEGQVKVYEIDYPTAPQLSMVRYALGSHFFDRGEYAKALSIFNSLEKSHLYKPQRVEFEFRKAYSNVKAGSHDAAEAGFREVLRQRNSIYTVPARYYLAYVYYVERKFDKAFPLFSQCNGDTRFSAMAAYYSVECKFMMGENDYVASEGVEVYQKASDQLRPSLARMISEAFYNKGDASTAERYLDVYRKSVTSLSRKDNYYSGILSYNLGAYRSAVESFSEVVSEKDALCQNAWYHMANSYLNLRNKLKAINAFRSAAGMDFDRVIKEDAMYNYAKLCFDVNSDISKFEEYLKMYPKSGKEDQVYGYMAASYILSKDYGAAVELLRKVRRPTADLTSDLQKASFLNALQLIEAGSYRNAMSMLQISMDNSKWNRDLKDLANYWMGECYYRSGRYAEAKIVQRQVLASQYFRYSDEYPLAVYSLAYSCFKSRDFNGAREYFTRFLSISPRDRSFDHDAMVRRADSYFMENNYKEAASAYEEVTSSDFTSDDIYPALQASIAYGLLGDDDKKVSTLSYVVRNNSTAPLYPAALYELGRTYVQLGRDTDAQECFYTLSGMKSDSTYYAKSLIELAMINANGGRYDRALDYYKRVVSEKPGSEDAQNALLGIESIYQSQNKPEEYFTYLDGMGMSAVKSGEQKEEMLFNAAQQIYMSGNYSSAMNALQSYLATYPDGKWSGEASWYLAESLRSTGRLEAAADAYSAIVKSGRGEYVTDAAAKVAALQYSLGHYSKAASSYDALASMDVSDSQRSEAVCGRMESNYKAKRYADAVSDGKKLLDYEGATDEIKRKASFIMAKSYLVTGERELAVKLFSDLSSDPSDAVGAESAYIIITDAYDSGDFKKTEDLVYKLSDSATKQTYWLAKSFIVLGDSYADREEWAQAKATFESIRDGYKAKDSGDDVQEQVRVRLERIAQLGE